MRVEGKGLRVAVLDDYQQVALAMADWEPVLARGTVEVFADHMVSVRDLVARLAAYHVVVLMRERTPMPSEVIEALPNLKLIVTTGARNSAVDLDAARRQNVVVSGTGSLGSGPVELSWALILGLSRNLLTETDQMRGGGWQTAIGRDLSGDTLGLLGLGRTGTRMAQIGTAFGMDVLAWSKNLTVERAAAVGARAVGFDALLRTADVLSVHLGLNDQTRSLLGARELALMKPTALLINTARGPIVDEVALIDALASGSLAGAGLDVYDVEPLPVDHPLRSTPRTLLTPHVGFVTERTYRRFFAEAVEDIMCFLGGEPIREL